MSYLAQRGAVAPIPLLNTSTDSSLQTIVGARFDSSDGREFVLVQNAGTALASGKLVQGPADIANHIGLTVTAFTAYSANGNQPAQVTVTLGATLVTANQYATGYLIVQTGTGIGQTLRIASHPAAAQSGSLVVTLEDSPGVALDTTSTVGLFMNPYGSLNGTDNRTDGVVVCPTTITGRVIGVSMYPIAASTATSPTYGLIQTRGVVSCLNQGGTSIGLDLMPSASVAGALCTYVVATKQRVGTATQAGTDAQSSLVLIQL